MKSFTRRQIYISIVFLVLALLLFVAIYLYASRTIINRQEQLLTLELESVENEIIHFYDEYFYNLEDVSNYIEIFGTDDLIEFLININQHHENIESIYYGTADNVMYNSSGFVPGPDFDLRTRIWYQMAVAKGETVITPAFLNATHDAIITTVSTPVYSDDILLGVLAIDINAATVSNFVSQEAIGETGYGILIDDEGHVIAHPEINVSDDQLIHIDAFDISLENYQDLIIYDNYVLDSSYGTMVYTRLFDDSYTLMVFMPNDEYYQTQMKFLNYFIVVMVIVGLISFSYVWMDFKHIFSPMNRLLDELAMINIKNNVSYRLSSNQKDSFYELRETINLALNDAENYFEEATLKSKQLFLENQRFRYLIESTQDFIIQVDQNLKIVYASGSGLKKINVSPEEVIGKYVNEFLINQVFHHDEIIRAALLGENKIYDWDVMHDEQRLIFETSASPIYNQEYKVMGVVLISRDITEARMKQEEIEYVNQHDYLTDLYNRRVFIETFENMSFEQKYPLTFMMLDLNGLKIINDAFGHHAGDEALIEVGNIFKKVFEDHFVARIGGDEFAVLLQGVEEDEVDRLKNTVRDEVSKIKIYDVNLSISLGYKMIYDDKLDSNEIMKAAENNMYRYKVTESMSVRNQAIRAIHKTLTDKYAEERIHSEKVSQLCYVFGLELGIKDEQLKELKLAGMYHDIGKIAIPDAILDKPDVLTHEEYEIMKTHTESGYNILRAADDYSRLAEYALTHHERWDGEGYPQGLKAEEIPLFSRIISLCDSFDAMTTNRVYRQKISKEKAVAEIIKGAGTQFDPKLAKQFVTKVLKQSWINK